MTLYITLTTPLTDANLFNLYSNEDGFTSAFATNISKVTLLSGYTAYNVPSGTTVVRIVSVGEVCYNYIEVNVSTTTTSTTSISV